MEDHDDDQMELDYWEYPGMAWWEERKQYVYAKYLGLRKSPNLYAYDAENKKILDIGGGPASLLLKCFNLKKGKVADPLDYPLWTKERYKHYNIDVAQIPGEDVTDTGFDEVWIYNCMQHAHSPEKIIANAKRAAPVLRIFEWIDIPPHPGHPIMLTESLLNNLIGSKGKTFVCNQDENIQGCYGRAYYGIFNLV